MQTSLDQLIARHEEKLVDRAAMTLKSMYGIGYADVAQEELEERLFRLFDAFTEITRRSAPNETLIAEIVDSVMVTPVYEGWSNRAITEEVLQVIDMVINGLIEQELAGPDKAEDRKNSQELLALSIRTAKDVVNGRSRRMLAEKSRRASRWTGSASTENR